MMHDPLSWRMRARRAASLLLSAVLPLACLDAAPLHAQGIMRTPSIRIEGRIPSVGPVISPRLNSDIAGTTASGIDRTSPNLRTRSACSYAYRNSDGDCRDQAVTPAGAGALSGKKGNAGPRSNLSQTAALGLPSVTGEIVAEIDGSLSDEQADALARRHGLARLQSQNFPLVGATIGLFRITDRRSFETVRRELATDTGFRSVQLNYRYLMQGSPAVLTEGDPAQYVLAKLRLPEAHTLAHGANVVVAVIDSAIDVKHPELANSIVDSFDALGSKEGPHVHGTGIAGAIAAHARLMGSAPAAKILAIRAFGTAAKGAESTSFVVLKGLDYAVAHGAQIINMSFAGPKDALIERGIAATAARGIVMVAASGNAGPKSPPLYPAADAHVIAVSATDAEDRLFAASNRGSYIAVAAPGVNIFLPAPDGKYQMTSGTSFSAAYVSGLVALLLERNPALKPDDVRAILMKTARDLGAPGRDDLFGAGEADAFAAVTAAIATPAAPFVAVSGPAAAARTSGQPDGPATRALNQPPASMAAEKPVVDEAKSSSAQ